MEQFINVELKSLRLEFHKAKKKKKMMKIWRRRRRRRFEEEEQEEEEEDLKHGFKKWYDERTEKGIGYRFSGRTGNIINNLIIIF